MSKLTELEQQADREARHGHRELVERLEEEKTELALQVIASQGQADEALGRVAELERQANDRAYRINVLERDRNVEIQEAKKARRERDTAWNAAIREAMKACHSAAYDGQYPQDDNIELGCLRSRDYIRALLRNEGGSDDQ